ncbi:MAG: orotidine-5'-phosphate decarboxylase [Propionibacteriaceae bacterium]|nr:orotidine-5'-phosphate decarboxylase [Propionibacteriaceae bacterium]
MGYFERLRGLQASRENICVGIDPHPALLAAWGLPDDAAGLERFSRTVVAALGEQVAAVKPQSAFFEQYGAAGIAVLEQVLADIKAAGAVAILDAKRGDIGSTMSAYARAYLADGSPLAADAVTLSPFLGPESLRPAVELAAQTGRGVYLLARTSNPEGAALQLARHANGVSVAQNVVNFANECNQTGQESFTGLVVGGTLTTLDIDLSGFTGSLLVPGIGAQGGSISALSRLFGQTFSQVLPMAGRAILAAGPREADLVSALENLLKDNEH